jgi:tRNA(Ile)-lysidine synthase
MLSEFEENLARYIDKNHLFKSDDKVVLAVSGGADSTALMFALCSLKEKKIISADFLCAHINHQLRGIDSETDEKFVISQAARLNMPVITGKIDVRGCAKKEKISIETAARNLRINSLIGIAKKNSCRIIATAHQADDNAETVIHRLLRGTGFRGLAGIKQKNVFEGNITFVRPLLCFTRKQIADYLNERGLNWRTDATNLDCRYKRNFIRHRLSPELHRQSSKPIVEILLRLSQAAQKFQASVSDAAQRLFPQIASCQTDGGQACSKNSVTLNINKFLLLHPAIKTELIYKAMLNLGCPEKDLTQKHYERILQLSQSEAGNKKIDLPRFFSVRREYEYLIIEKPPPQEAKNGQSFENIEIAVPSKIQAGNLFIETKLLEGNPPPPEQMVRLRSPFDIENFKKNKSAYTERFDFDKIIQPINIRKRRDGDKFCPLGRPAEKKIGKFLTDQKIPLKFRQKILIVSDREKILWVWPVRISELVKVTSQTKKILQMQITNK